MSKSFSTCRLDTILELDSGSDLMVLRKNLKLYVTCKSNSSTNYGVYISVATKLRRSSKLRRFLSEDPSSSSSSVHFQMPKNLRSFEDFRPKIAKIFWENLTIFFTKLSEKVQKYVLFLKL